jgi:glutathione S-transferase
MLKIHDFRGFPNPARIRIALAEKRLNDRVQFVPVDVPAGEHKKPEFLAKNPAGAVPVLELEDGTYIAECTAITEYIEHLDGEPFLTG